MPNPALIHHNATQFAKQIIELAPGVWGAIGFAASNVYVIVGKTSLTVIDTSESTGAAENILREIRTLTDKPVGRIIYTHSHRDHISGANVFAEGGSVPILASTKFSSDLVAVDEQAIAPNKALGRRTQAQFGIGLSSDERISLGCGPGNRPMQGLGAGHIPPTELVADDRDIDLDGVLARLIMAPGETDDHMVVWLPELKILFGGDNWYHAFPNLYAILSMDDIATSIALPPELADKPWLGEFYGKASWSARAFAAGTLGWYDGNPTNLGSISSKSRAEKMARLAGGAEALLRAATDSDDLQWRLELCDHLIVLGEKAQQLKAEALLALAETEINATARNTYIWEAKQLLSEESGG